MNDSIKNKIEKLTAVMAAMFMGVSALSLSACEKPIEERKSELIGAFESSESTDAVLTNEKSNIGGQTDDGSPYLYTTDVYPLNTVNNEGVRYTAYQKLRLKRDYTYEYTLEITLRKVTTESNTDLVKLAATTVGTFDYDRVTESLYTVTVSDPTGGSESRFGANITGEGNIYGWKQSSTANYVIDMSRLAADGGQFDRYVAGKTVSVAKIGSERVLTNDAFFADILTDVAPYCSYNGGAKPNDPDEPNRPDDPDDPDPEEYDRKSTLPAKKYGDTAVCYDAADGAIRLSVPSTVTSVSIGNDASTVFESVDGKNVFDFPIGYARLADTVRVSAGNDIFDFDIKNYLAELAEDYSSKPVEERAAARVAASLLNAASAYGDVTLTQEQAALVYDDNRYCAGDWGLRDNLTQEAFPFAAEGFTSGGVPTVEIGDGVMLTFSFEADERFTDVNVKARMGGDPVDVKLEKNGGKYSFAVSADDPNKFADDISFDVYDGAAVIGGGTASYSVTRALARVRDKGTVEADKNKATALYSLAKSVAWLERNDRVVYAYEPSTSFGFEASEFSYTESAAPVDYGDVWGVKLYVDGVKLSDRKTEHVRDGIRATRDGGVYGVELDGANIDGIFTEDPATSVTVDVKKDSRISYAVSENIGFDRVTGSVYVNGDLIVTGEVGAVLDIYGNVFVTGNISTENVTVRIHTYDKSVAAVRCGGTLDIRSGKIECGYIGDGAGVYGLNAVGSINISGDVSLDGFGTGIYLGGDEAQTLTVSSGSVAIAADKYGISGADVINDNVYACRELYFAGGVTDITVGLNGTAGISACNVTVDSGELCVTAKSGSALERKYLGGNEWNGWQATTSYVSLKTISGDPDVGKVSLVNESGEYTACLAELSIDGGSVYIAGKRSGGVIASGKADAVFSVNNGDLAVENTAEDHGHGIEMTQGGETLDIASSSRFTVKNCIAAVATWGTPSAPTVNNRGLMILDGYGLDFTGWEFQFWELPLVMNNDGEIRQINKF